MDDIRTTIAQTLIDISPSGLIRHLGSIEALPSGIAESSGAATNKLRNALRLDQHTRLLKALYTLVKVYKYFGDATVAITLTSTKLHNAKWMPSTNLKTSTDDMASSQSHDYSLTLFSLIRSAAYYAFEPLELDLASLFACIAMLESGSIDLASTGLQSVMAILLGDSL